MSPHDHDEDGATSRAMLKSWSGVNGEFAGRLLVMVVMTVLLIERSVK